ncbi:MAG TPA: DUF433 domain-containing protein [Planctomycetota bacterium]
MAVAAINSIDVDEKGVARIAGTTTKVVEIVLDNLAHGWSPEEIRRQHYGDLSLAQIHAAFAYYYEHQAAMDAGIERSYREYEELRKANLNSPLRAKLHAQGLLP